jgi:hypothetical protein
MGRALDGNEPLTFLGRPISPSFELRAVTVGPGDSRTYDDAEWQGALVVLERGELELERRDGGRQPLHRGAVVCLASLPLRALHNPGREAALLGVVLRRDGCCSLALASDMALAALAHVRSLLPLNSPLRAAQLPRRSALARGCGRCAPFDMRSASLRAGSLTFSTLGFSLERR